MNYDLIRGAVALLATAALAYWTYRRIRGQGDDPTLRMSKNSETGTSSFLVSGLDAVAVVAIGMTVALWPEIEANPLLGVLPLSVVFVHWFAEKEERT